MSYLHCPTCKRAYNLAVQATCPYCPVAATVVDPAADIIAAAERLAEAMARATPAERTAAAARIQQIQIFAPPSPPAPPPAPKTRTEVVLSFARGVVERSLRPRLRRITERVTERVRQLAA